MINFVVTHRNRANIEAFLRYWSWSAPLMRSVRRIFYHDLWKEQPPGLYIFGDLDFLSGRERKRLSTLVEQLSASPECYTLLNRPDRFLERYELLSLLHRQGINPFAVHGRLKMRETVQYPVFVRQKNNPMSTPSKLLHSREEVRAFSRKLKWRFDRRHNWFAEEFCDTSDEEGTFRKFGAFCIGDRVIPRHLHFSKQWMLKYPDERNGRRFAEELSFVRSNSPADVLRLAAQASGVDYGRIDFSLKDGKPVIWEINTNPVIMDGRDRAVDRHPIPQLFLQRFLAALQDLLPPAVKPPDLDVLESLELEASLG